MKLSQLFDPVAFAHYIGKAYAEFVPNKHCFAMGYQAVVDIKVQRLSCKFVQFNDIALRHGEQILELYLAPAYFYGYLERNIIEKIKSS